MKSIYAGLVAVAVIGLLSGTTVRADDKEAKKSAAVPAPAVVLKDTTVKGTVIVTKDDKGELKGAELKSADGTTYECGPMSQCKALEADNGKIVECKGIVTTAKDGQHRLRIHSINAHPSA